MKHKYFPGKQVLGFKIFYSDGSCKSSKQGKWQELPQDAVQVVVFYFGDGSKTLFTGQDLYCINDSYAIEISKEIKRGEMLPSEKYDEIYREAKESKW